MAYTHTYSAIVVISMLVYCHGQDPANLLQQNSFNGANKLNIPVLDQQEAMPQSNNAGANKQLKFPAPGLPDRLPELANPNRMNNLLAAQNGVLDVKMQPKPLQDVPIKQAAASEMKQYRKNSNIKLLESEECGADIKALCAENQRRNNFAILDCLQNQKKVPTTSML